MLSIEKILLYIAGIATIIGVICLIAFLILDEEEESIY